MPKLNEITPGELEQACSRYKEVLNDEGKLLKNRDAFVRSAFFSTAELENVISKTQSTFVKVYYGIDKKGENFMFVAPIDKDGKALDADDTISILCCCAVPPCPPNDSDRYIKQ